MKVAKRISTRTWQTALISKAFDDFIVKSCFPLNADYIELNVGYGTTFFDDEKIIIGIDEKDRLFSNMDARLARTLLAFEFFRVYVRKLTCKEIPVFIENVIIGKEMARRGMSADLSYLFYTLVMTEKSDDVHSFLKRNLPWIVFQKNDSFNYELFRSYSNDEISPAAKKLFSKLQEDLFDQKTLDACIKLYEDVLNAGD